MKQLRTPIWIDSRFSAIFENIIPAHSFQKSEVSQIKWVNLEESLTLIRPYHLEKKDMIITINKTLEKYRLIS